MPYYGWPPYGSEQVTSTALPGQSTDDLLPSTVEALAVTTSAPEHAITTSAREHAADDSPEIRSDQFRDGAANIGALVASTGKARAGNPLLCNPASTGEQPPYDSSLADATTTFRSRASGISPITVPSSTQTHEQTIEQWRPAVGHPQHCMRCGTLSASGMGSPCLTSATLAYVETYGQCSPDVSHPHLRMRCVTPSASGMGSPGTPSLTSATPTYVQTYGKRSPDVSHPQFRMRCVTPSASVTSPPRSSLTLADKRSSSIIALTDDNLVVESPVSERVLRNATYNTGKEFTHMRYTAVTCDPDDFVKERYTLRQEMYGRAAELAVVITLYNEEDELFCKSMSAVMKNIAYLCKRTYSGMWGNNGWQKATVCIVADGREKVHPSVLTCLSTMGIYQEGIAKNMVHDKEVTGHIYEYTTQVMIDQELEVHWSAENTVPVQVIFLLKEKNKKKLNSHRWFFNAFAPIIKPNVCVLLDVGTKPSEASLYNMWKAFDRDPQLGGACGNISPELGKRYKKLLNPLVATQNFEYKMANILDKPLESFLGFIAVLPGAFSAYRYSALQDSVPGEGPLSQYLKGETVHGSGSSVFEANMYLAEDRILSFELIAKKKARWLVRYVKAAEAETDVPDNIPEFISQRRRWLNGAFFAAVYAVVNWKNIWDTKHSLGRKLLLQLEFVYNTLTLIFNWFSLANFYLTFFFLGRLAINGDGGGPFGKNSGATAKALFDVVCQLYIAVIAVAFICALGNRPQGTRFIYTTIMVLFAVIMLLMLYLGAYTIVEQSIRVLSDGRGGYQFANIPRELRVNASFRDLFVGFVSSYGVYVISSILYLEPWHLITSIFQYLLMLPAFTNVLLIYAYCNTHDVSWGTKGDNAGKTDLGTAFVTINNVGVRTAMLSMPTQKEDINNAYELAVYGMAARRQAKSKKGRDGGIDLEDRYKLFRTRLVLFWIITNALFAFVLTLPLSNGEVVGASKRFSYIGSIFWTVTGMSVVRLTGSISYLVLDLVNFWGH